MLFSDPPPGLVFIFGAPTLALTSAKHHVSPSFLTKRVEMPGPPTSGRRSARRLLPRVVAATVAEANFHLALRTTRWPERDLFHDRLLEK